MSYLTIILLGKNFSANSGHMVLLRCIYFKPFQYFLSFFLFSMLIIFRHFFSQHSIIMVIISIMIIHFYLKYLLAVLYYNNIHVRFVLLQNVLAIASDMMMYYGKQITKKNVSLYVQFHDRKKLRKNTRQTCFFLLQLYIFLNRSGLKLNIFYSFSLPTISFGSRLLFRNLYRVFGVICFRKSAFNIEFEYTIFQNSVF